MKVDNNNVSVPAMRIRAFNPTLIDNLYNNKPKEVDERVWAILPEEIKSRWARFSIAMQEHIVKC